MPTLPLSYYQNPDVVFLARDLLGKFLLSSFEDKLTGGMIIETEAYRGPEDRASHAYNNRRTKRTEIMFQMGGFSYVYLIYGLYPLFNVVTNQAGIPHAILIRALKPEMGIEEMVKRRGKSKLDKQLTSGPGTLAQALGIEVHHSGLPLDQPPIWIEDRGIRIEAEKIVARPRIGVAYAREDADLPWRFTWEL